MVKNTACLNASDGSVSRYSNVNNTTTTIFILKDMFKIICFLTTTEEKKLLRENFE